MLKCLALTFQKWNSKFPLCLFLKCCFFVNWAQADLRDKLEKPNHAVGSKAFTLFKIIFAFPPPTFLFLVSLQKWTLFRSTCRAKSAGLSSSCCFLLNQLSKNEKYTHLQHRNFLCTHKIPHPGATGTTREVLYGRLPCWCCGLVPDTPVSANWETWALPAGASSLTLPCEHFSCLLSLWGPMQGWGRACSWKISVELMLWQLQPRKASLGGVSCSSGERRSWFMIQR